MTKIPRRRNPKTASINQQPSPPGEDPHSDPQRSRQTVQQCTQEDAHHFSDTTFEK